MPLRVPSKIDAQSLEWHSGRRQRFGSG